ncbi:MAG TPA: DUF4442 domain-containing protein [Nocardia sp.]|uniref:PaaI family thioesterase n=1 Tax=Nocardia TaxID=1817 RepID=UPI00245420A4|nr:MULTISPECIES: DUF4442 domain-containing protein [Nocardia]HLS75846.1 DUF4442 domain-containing protein [Nocardia sp.]
MTGTHTEHRPRSLRHLRSLRSTALTGPTAFRLLMNCYPPLLFSGIRVRAVAPDWTAVHVTHHVRPWNRNVNGTAFGGTLFAMTDPFYAVMAAGRLGPGYRIWNARAAIEFVRPGHGRLEAAMHLPATTATTIRAEADATGRSVTTHTTEIRAADGELVARCTQDLHVRKIG